jgi:hypothetical protein
VLVAGVVAGGAAGIAGRAFPEAGEFLPGVIFIPAFGFLLAAFAEMEYGCFAEIQFFTVCFFHFTDAGFVILKTGKNFCVKVLFGYFSAAAGPPAAIVAGVVTGAFAGITAGRVVGVALRDARASAEVAVHFNLLHVAERGLVQTQLFCVVLFHVQAVL